MRSAQNSSKNTIISWWPSQQFFGFFTKYPKLYSKLYVSYSRVSKEHSTHHLYCYWNTFCTIITISNVLLEECFDRNQSCIVRTDNQIYFLNTGMIRLRFSYVIPYRSSCFSKCENLTFVLQHTHTQINLFVKIVWRNSSSNTTTYEPFIIQKFSRKISSLIVLCTKLSKENLSRSRIWAPHTIGANDMAHREFYRR